MKIQRFFIFLFILLFTSFACGNTDIPPTPENSVFDSGRTAYGFFPSPPQATLESVLNHFETMSQHGDFILIQQNTDWESFVNGIDGES